MTYRIFIQARMSSNRLPGKMLAPFRGRPLVAQVLGRFRESGLLSRLVLLTSVDPTDDPLADYVAARCGVAVVRGELDNVVARFQAAIVAHPCEWFVRISGDSPYIDPSLVEAVASWRDGGHDVISNVVQRTFPAGQSVECVRSSVFCTLDPETLTADQREHVTKVFYDRPADWRMRSVVCSDARWMGERMVVDTLEDLRRLEDGAELPPSFGALAVAEAA
ncbi:cytidylyltransferase domain-containing protein [Bradyrhizobium sp. HKCCYLS2038]|uniref:cytidylyltransferase domain-containing protein n=1 Tax=unclassified Bradyrhizobium TaxID=2631580 RepID=UPI003EBB9A6C